jgi:hypothetical protein
MLWSEQGFTLVCPTIGFGGPWFGGGSGATGCPRFCSHTGNMLPGTSTLKPQKQLHAFSGSLM